MRRVRRAGEVGMTDVSVLRGGKRPGNNEPCWCGSGAKYKKCHRDADDAALLKPKPRVLPGRVSPMRPVPAHIPRPDYAATGTPGPGTPIDHATRDERMRRACRAAGEVLREVGALVKPGVTTDELDAACHEAYVKRGGYPSTLNYRHFPKSLCTSVNEVILHGIPDDRPLEAGDIVNCDVTIFLDGMHGDCSATFAVGEVDERSKRLMRATYECLMLGIEQVKPGRPMHAIGRAIEQYARKLGYGVVSSYCGHGIGETFHADPHVSHVFDPHDDAPMVEGQFFTIEPMLTEGSVRQVVWPDKWTVVTADGGRAAQYEHTIRVGRDGAELLTAVDPPAFVVP